jgi:tetratricopeptide (TPR) repeat protein
MLEKIIPVVEKTLGERHVGMYMTLGNLARAYGLSKMWEKAEEVLSSLLEAIPNEHPDWLNSTIALAKVRILVGRLEEAELDCERLLEMTSPKNKSDSRIPQRSLLVAFLLKIYSIQERAEDTRKLKEKYPDMIDDSGNVKDGHPTFEDIL